MSTLHTETAPTQPDTETLMRALDEYVNAVMEYSRALDDLLDRSPVDAHR